MDNNMLELILTALIAIQSTTIVIGSVIVLQGVLNKCSKMLRLAFVVFPIGASLGLLDLLNNKSVHLSAVVINISIILILYWMWNQKNMFLDLNQLIKNKETPSGYSFKSEIRAILSCFAIWVLRKVNPNIEARCVVCEQILPQ